MHATKDRCTAYNRIARTRVARSALPLLGACWIAITSVRTAQAQVVSSEAVRNREPASHFTGTLPFTVRVLGDGPPVVLIPGLTNTGDVWNATVDSLATQYRCHVLSLAGFGGTPPVATDSTWLPRMRDAIIAYIRLQPLEKPILIGHSLGGHLALDIAATAPDLPRAVINVDGLPFPAAASLNGGGTVERVRPMAIHLRQQMRTAPPMPDATMNAQLRSLVRDTTHLPMLRTMQRASDPATVTEAMFGLYTTDLRPALARIRVPVLNLHAWVAYRPHGQTRVGVETMLADQYAKLARHTTRISDTGHHFLMLDEPAWFLREVRAFLTTR